jgi:ornithine cyclodeaminase/alanine dehydrogenase-like protein (mu-crystallin family)
VEAGDLLQVLGDDVSAWSAVKELSEIVAGGTPGRTQERQVTLFKSNGVAIEDLAVAVRVYELALERGLGEQVALNFAQT